MGQGTNIQIIRYTVYKSSYMSDILSSDRCMYQGKEYKQGEGWQESCDTYCVCEDAVYGYYRCTNR